MPIYEFECPKHGRFEVMQAMLEEHRAICPQCGLDSRRLFSVPAGIKVKELVHADSGIPQWLNTTLTNKPNELWDRNLARQGKKIDPEDM